MEETSAFKQLLNKINAKYTREQNAEMVALTIAAGYQHDTLHRIINSKMHGVLPSLASEAYTTVNGIAEKVLNNMGDEDGKEDQEGNS